MSRFDKETRSGGNVTPENISSELLLTLIEHIEAAKNASIGTKATGYTKKEWGPFLCINCVHSDREGIRCDHPEVIADPETEKIDGKAVIEPADCCNEFRPRKEP